MYTIRGLHTSNRYIYYSCVIHPALHVSIYTNTHVSLSLCPSRIVGVAVAIAVAHDLLSQCSQSDREMLHKSIGGMLSPTPLPTEAQARFKLPRVSSRQAQTTPQQAIGNHLATGHYHATTMEYAAQRIQQFSNTV